MVLSHLLEKLLSMNKFIFAFFIIFSFIYYSSCRKNPDSSNNLGFVDTCTANLAANFQFRKGKWYDEYYYSFHPNDSDLRYIEFLSDTTILDHYPNYDDKVAKMKVSNCTDYERGLFSDRPEDQDKKVYGFIIYNKDKMKLMMNIVGPFGSDTLFYFRK